MGAAEVPPEAIRPQIRLLLGQHEPARCLPKPGDVRGQFALLKAGAELRHLHDREQTRRGIGRELCAATQRPEERRMPLLGQLRRGNRRRNELGGKLYRVLDRSFIREREPAGPQLPFDTRAARSTVARGGHAYL